MDSDMLLFAFSIYALVACLFLAETYLEGEKTRAGWDAWRWLGLAAGLVWPVHLLAVIGFLSLTDRFTRISRHQTQ